MLKTVPGCKKIKIIVKFLTNKVIESIQRTWTYRKASHDELYHVTSELVSSSLDLPSAFLFHSPYHPFQSIFIDHKRPCGPPYFYFGSITQSWPKFWFQNHLSTKWPHSGNWFMLIARAIFIFFFLLINFIIIICLLF